MSSGFNSAFFAALLVALAGLFATGAAADVIYKIRLKDGSIAFTDRPPPGAEVLEKREVLTAPPPTATPPAKLDPAAVDARLRARAAEQERREAEVATAEHALAQAREQLEKGRQPQAGDFMGTAKKGIVRRSPAFEERVRALEQAVTDAEARLAKAIEARDAAR